MGDSNDQSGKNPICIPLVCPNTSPSSRKPKAVLAGTVVTFVGIVPFEFATTAAPEAEGWALEKVKVGELEEEKANWRRTRRRPWGGVADASTRREEKKRRDKNVRVIRGRSRSKRRKRIEGRLWTVLPCQSCVDI